MNHKERVLSVFKEEKPDRFPMWFGGASETLENLKIFLDVASHEEVLEEIGIDFRTVRPEYAGPPLKTYDDGSWETFWGIRRKGEHYGQAITHPLEQAENVEQVENYDWPNIEDWSFEHLEQEIEKYKEYAIIGGSWAPFFHDTAELMGFENMLIKMLEKPKIVEAVVDRCFRFYYNLSEKMFEMVGDRIDLFFVGNDFGAEKDLLFSPDLWRKFFKKRFKKLVDLGREYDIYFAIHSCGDISSIIPDLIEIGVDALNPIQISTKGMNPKRIFDKYGEELIFFGGIDVREILEKGTQEEVAKETRRIIDILGGYDRYITAPSHDYLLPEIPPENIVTMYEESMKYSKKILS